MLDNVQPNPLPDMMDVADGELVPALPPFIIPDNHDNHERRQRRERALAEIAQ